jgi:N6-L-threonylcarbamoyladenine synthase
MTKKIHILAIETSCDDTSVSIIQAKEKGGLLKGFKVVSNKTSSQVELHAGYGGVYPALAKREHKKNLPQVFKAATKGFDVNKIDLFAITVGPGLDPCLWTGINFIQEMLPNSRKPSVPVNHVEAHILANFLSKVIGEAEFGKKYLPAAALAVSGGHTMLFRMEKIGKYELLGQTRDDAAGECFDKAARILGLGYPGGPQISEQARRYEKRKKPVIKITLPRPMLNQKNYDFSFSGLKTAVLYCHKKQKPEIAGSKEYLEAMSCEIEQAIVDVLVAKTIKAALNTQAVSIIAGGGVAANGLLRKRLRSEAKKFNLKLLLPEEIYCADNAAMIGVAGYFGYQRGEAVSDPGSLKSDPNLLI